MTLCLIQFYLFLNGVQHSHTHTHTHMHAHTYTHSCTHARTHARIMGEREGGLNKLRRQEKLRPPLRSASKWSHLLFPTSHKNSVGVASPLFTTSSGSNLSLLVTPPPTLSPQYLESPVFVRLCSVATGLPATQKRALGF